MLKTRHAQTCISWHHARFKKTDVLSNPVKIKYNEIVSKGLSIGVLGVQGDYAKHIEALDALPGVNGRLVRFPEDIAAHGGLIIPGGESTTLTILFDRWGYRQAILDYIVSGGKVWGTCAGAIMLGTKVVDGDEFVDVMPLGAIDVTVDRNAFGRQTESFESDVSLEFREGIIERFNGVFIRAPRFRDAGRGARVLGRLGGEPVMIEQGRVLISSFHPELTGDLRVHAYFAGKIADVQEETA